MAHCQLRPQMTRILSDMRDDSWGRGTWSGGHPSFTTQITGGGSGSSTQSKQSVDANYNNASGGIMVETVVQQEVEDISEMPELASLITPPPMVKLNTSSLV